MLNLEISWLDVKKVIIKIILKILDPFWMLTSPHSLIYKTGFVFGYYVFSRVLQNFKNWSSNVGVSFAHQFSSKRFNYKLSLIYFRRNYLLVATLLYFSIHFLFVFLFIVFVLLFLSVRQKDDCSFVVIVVCHAASASIVVSIVHRCLNISKNSSHI